jgi:hypothetical protein
MTAGGVCAPHAPCSFHREADVALRFTFPVASFDTFDVPRGIIAYFGFQPSEDKVSFTGTASGTAGGTARLTYDYRTVPEPGTLALLLIGALGWWVAHLPTRRRA